LLWLDRNEHVEPLHAITRSVEHDEAGIPSRPQGTSNGFVSHDVLNLNPRDRHQSPDRQAESFLPAIEALPQVRRRAGLPTDDEEGR
jgi:hypothetical protein